MMRLIALILLALGCGLAHADTPIALFKSFAGNLNFVGTQKTMRTQPNAVDPCAVVSNTTTLTATLAGIPAGAVIVSAQLYWAASNSQANADYTVTFEGAAVSAPAGRRFFSPTVGYDYFAGAADVTAQVTAKRNGNYTFSGLTVNNGSPYCPVEAVIGGFSLLVVYSLPTETFRVLNVYEGFQYIRNYAGDNISVTLNLSNFKIPSPIGSATGRVGHITWEGDSTLSGGGEDLLFNNVEMVDATNPTGNQFNSKSNINADPNSYGIDFDAYSVASPTIVSGQTSAATIYRSGQDLVLLNAEIIAVPNVPVADLAISMAFAGTAARGQAITYTQTVSSLGPSTEPGPITVTHTLPTGLNYVSAAGTGWTCVPSGQVVACTNPGPLASGAALSPITLNATIASNAAGVLTTNTSVTGALFDNVTGNSRAAHSISITSDLAIAMTLSDPPLTLGQSNAYLIAVTNNGSSDELGPVTVSGTLPGSLTYAYAGGDGWSCTNSGQVVACTYAGALATGATLPTLSVNVTVDSVAGTVSTTFTINGTGFDPTSSNNSATLDSAMTIPKYVFTDSACTRNVDFGASQPCKIMLWTARTAGTPVSGIYVSVLNGTGTPVRLSQNATTNAMGFALSCHNPTTGNGTLGTFSALGSGMAANLPACAANGAMPGTFSSSVSLAYAGNSPSAGPFTFTYGDVGRVELFMRDSAGTPGVGASGPFVVKPAGFTLTPSVAAPVTAAVAAFAKAGAAFSMSVTAVTSSGVAAKNFGREIAPESVRLTLAAATDSATGAAFSDMSYLPPLNGSFGAFTNGVASGAAFSWDEAGIIRLTPSVATADYLGAGDVTGTAANVGRFYADHFNTVTVAPMRCTTTLACPGTVSGMAYSGQPVPTTVTAYNAGGTALRNYIGKFAKAATLSAFNAPGTSTASTPGTLTLGAIAASAFTLVANASVANATPVYTLPVPYASATPLAAWGAPVTLYLRATEDLADGASSQRAGASVEGGVASVNGRLLVTNTYGSELLKMPVQLAAQYWTGTRWEGSVNDSSSTVTLSAAAMRFTGCLKGLAGVVANTCKSALLTAPATPAMANIVNGVASFKLNPTGAGNIGSADLTMGTPGVGNPAWLPSTTGRIVFGIYKATPVIYIRELY